MALFAKKSGYPCLSFLLVIWPEETGKQLKLPFFDSTVPQVSSPKALKRSHFPTTKCHRTITAVEVPPLSVKNKRGNCCVKNSAHRSSQSIVSHLWVACDGLWTKTKTPAEGGNDWWEDPTDRYGDESIHVQVLVLVWSRAQSSPQALQRPPPLLHPLTLTPPSSTDKLVLLSPTKHTVASPTTVHHVTPFYGRAMWLQLPALRVNRDLELVVSLSGFCAVCPVLHAIFSINMFYTVLHCSNAVFKLKNQMWLQ